MRERPAAFVRGTYIGYSTAAVSWRCVPLRAHPGQKPASCFLLPLPALLPPCIEGFGPAFWFRSDARIPHPTGSAEQLATPNHPSTSWRSRFLPSAHKTKAHDPHLLSLFPFLPLACLDLAHPVTARAEQNKQKKRMDGRTHPASPLSRRAARSPSLGCTWERTSCSTSTCDRTAGA